MASKKQIWFTFRVFSFGVTTSLLTIWSQAQQEKSDTQLEKHSIELVETLIRGLASNQLAEYYKKEGFSKATINASLLTSAIGGIIAGRMVWSKHAALSKQYDRMLESIADWFVRHPAIAQAMENFFDGLENLANQTDKPTASNDRPEAAPTIFHFRFDSSSN